MGAGSTILILLLSQDNYHLVDLAGQLSYDFVLGRGLKDNSDLVDLAGQL
jgi:hypothetical protein